MSTVESSNNEALPPNWSTGVAPNGRTFFVDHSNRLTTWEDPRNGRVSLKPIKYFDDDLEPLPEGWEERMHSDGRIFFINHKARTTQWDDPRLDIPTIAGRSVAYSEEYQTKYKLFRQQLKKPKYEFGKFQFQVRRTFIFEDSCNAIMDIRTTDMLRQRLFIRFANEDALDFGGVTREWLSLLSKEMFNPNYGLFEYSAMENYTLQINRASGLCNAHHLDYFKFIGRVAGMAVYHRKLLDAYFAPHFFKMMLVNKLNLEDIGSIDKEFYNSLVWIKENDPKELEMTFSIDEEIYGKRSQCELKPGGSKISVTNDNKDKYIELVIKRRFVDGIREQMTAFLNGFTSVIPLKLIKIFDAEELKWLLCGIQIIDVKDWRKHTFYKGGYHENHLVIQWFWRIVLSFSNEMRARLLQFVTGTAHVPMNGFKELYGAIGPQMFTIEKCGARNSYPRSHTCYNKLDLPPYRSYEELKEKLVNAFMNSEGFGGVD